MNKLAIISAFLGGVKNRYMTYEEDRILEEKFRMASKIKGVKWRIVKKNILYTKIETAGLEPARLFSHGFTVHRNNHSAISLSSKIKLRRFELLFLG